MHENRHFLSYRKRLHDAENHVHLCTLRHSGESLQNDYQPQGNWLGQNSSSNLQGWSSDTIVSSWAFISSLLFNLSWTLLGAWRFDLFRSVYVNVCCPAMLLSLVSGLYHVHGLRVSSLCPIARWHYLPPLSFQKVLLLFSLSFPLLFHHPFFLFYLWFIGHFVPTC